MSDVRIGVIGGSGLYEMAGLTVAEERRIETPWGAPSDAYILGELDGRKVAFLARHGRGHRLLPTELNFRANVYGFKTLGVEFLISVSAVGSLKKEYVPGHIVVPDQFYDRTRHRPDTFFGNGIVAHVSVAHPVSKVAGVDPRRFRRRRRRRDPPRRLLRQHGRSAVLDPRRVDGVSPHGLRHHRHDQPPGGEAGARGRDRLRLALDGHRLRLLARGGRGGHRRGRDGGPAQERRSGAARRAARHRRARTRGRQRLLERPGDVADHRPEPGTGRHPRSRSSRSIGKYLDRSGGKLAWRR